MATATNHSVGGTYWGHLIQPNKTASPKLEQLCLGLAKIIGKLEPGPDTELTPTRLAAFYRSVGGNYDSLFLGGSDSGLSLIYKTLGCLHSLQPTANAFEYPTLPALTPRGYIQWQKMQILLTPGEHVPLIQEAVKRYDVPTPDGGTFPKLIPKEAFPDKPDKETENWYRFVTGRLDQSTPTARIKNSPYQLPRDPREQADSYFPSNGSNRPSRPPRPNSHDRATAHASEYRRRSSVPDLPSPPPTSSEPPQVNPQPRSHPSYDHHQHRGSTSQPKYRSSDASSSKHRQSNSSHRTSTLSASNRSNFVPPPRPDPSNSLAPQPSAQPTNGHYRHQSISGATRARPTSPSTIDESSGSEASSENSQGGQGRNPHQRRQGRYRTSLFPSISFNFHQRRHSHDASYVSEEKPPLPPRPDNGMTRSSRNSRPPTSGSAHQNGNFVGPPAVSGGPVLLQNNLINSRDDAVNSAPESPGAREAYRFGKNPQLRCFDPMGNRALLRNGEEPGFPRENGFGSGTDGGRDGLRKTDVPRRIAAASGVNGRKYAPVEQRSPGTPRMKQSPPQQVGLAGMGADRRATWE